MTVIQCFASGLQLNIHFHTLVLDGVFNEARPGHLIFHPAPAPRDEDVAQLLATVRTRVGQLLARHRLEPEDDAAPADPLTEASPLLAGLVSASVQDRAALGPRAGARVRRLGDEPDLGHATSRAPARPSSMASISTPMSGSLPTIALALKQLCRYLLRPPLAQERIQLRPDGRVLIRCDAWTARTILLAVVGALPQDRLRGPPRALLLGSGSSRRPISLQD